MPFVEEHCRISEVRTGKPYLELHRWMDEPSKEKGIYHREERHALNQIDFLWDYLVGHPSRMRLH